MTEEAEQEDNSSRTLILPGLIIGAVLIGPLLVPELNPFLTSNHGSPSTDHVLREFHNANNTLNSTLTYDDVAHKTETSYTKAEKKMEKMESSSLVTCHVTDAFEPKKCQLTQKGRKKAENVMQEYRWQKRTKPMRTSKMRFAEIFVENNQTLGNGSIHVVKGEIEYGGSVAGDFAETVTDTDFMEDYEEEKISGSFTINITDRYRNNLTIQSHDSIEVGEHYRESRLEKVRRCGEGFYNEQIEAEVRRSCTVKVVMEHSTCLTDFERFDDANVVLTEAGGFCVR